MLSKIVPICIISFALLSCSGYQKEEWIKVYPKYQPWGKDSVVPVVQISQFDTKSDVLGIFLSTPTIRFRTTEDAPLTIYADKSTKLPGEYNIFVSIESDDKHCIDIAERIHFYFSDGTYIKLRPDSDHNCEGHASFSVGGQYDSEENRILWEKLLATPLEEVRVKAETVDHAIIQGLTKGQSEAIRQSLENLTTATSGVELKKEEE